MKLLAAPITLLIASTAFATTYYVSPAGNDANPGTFSQPWLTIQKAASTLTAGDAVLIRAGTYREMVAPVNSGSAGAYITYAAYPGETVTLDGTGIDLPTDTGLFDIPHAANLKYIRVTGLNVTNSGTNDLAAGIRVEDADHIMIDHNSTYHTRSSGIGIWASSNVTVTENTIRMACYSGGNQETLTMAETTNFEIAYNRILDGPSDPGGGEGICIKQGSIHGSVHDNDVQGLQRVGIYVDAWNLPTGDIDIYRNVVHDTYHEGIAVASEMGGQLDGVNITNNIVHDAGGNGIIVAYWGDTTKTHPLRNIRVINNTVVDNGSGTYGGGISVENQWADTVVVRNNIATGNYAFQLNSGYPSIPNLSIDHNLIDEVRGMEPTETRGENYQEERASFVNPNAHNYHVLPTSLAIDHGSSIDAPATDFDVRSRPQGSAFDIGAFEYTPVTAPKRRAVGK